MHFIKVLTRLLACFCNREGIKYKIVNKIQVEEPYVWYRTLSLSGRLTLILELAVVGRLFLSVLRFSGNKLRMKSLRREKKGLTYFMNNTLCQIQHEYFYDLLLEIRIWLRDLLFAALHELYKVREENVTVPLTEADDIVRHLRQNNKIFFFLNNNNCDSYCAGFPI